MRGMIHISGSTFNASHEPPGRSGASHNSHATHSSASMQIVIAAVSCVMRKWKLLRKLQRGFGQTPAQRHAKFFLVV